METDTLLVALDSQNIDTNSQNPEGHDESNGGGVDEDWLWLVASTRLDLVDAPATAAMPQILLSITTICRGLIVYW